MREDKTPQASGLGESCGVGRDESDPGHGQAGCAFARGACAGKRAATLFPTERCTFPHPAAFPHFSTHHVPKSGQGASAAILPPRLSRSPGGANRRRRRRTEERSARPRVRVTLGVVTFVHSTPKLYMCILDCNNMHLVPPTEVLPLQTDALHIHREELVAHARSSPVQT